MLYILAAASLLLCGCGQGNLDGTYENEQNSEEILLVGAHKLVVLDSGYLDYAIDGNSIIVTSPSGRVTGAVKGRRLVFPPVTSADIPSQAVSRKLQGTWTRVITFPFR